MIPPPISVVIPAYRAAATLPRALDSVVAQDWPSIEVVVVDDCSPDDTAAVAERYAKLPVRIVRRTANGGRSFPAISSAASSADRMKPFTP